MSAAPSIVPRERVYGKQTPSPPAPTFSELLAARRERERKELEADAWAAGFRAAEALHLTSITYGEPSGHARITMKTIIEEVAEKYGYSVTELKSTQRHRDLVVARHEAMWRCKKETINSLPAIGRAFGNKDHTTVLNGSKRHEERLAAAAAEAAAAVSGREE